jgi:hypothetical protein
MDRLFTCSPFSIFFILLCLHDSDKVVELLKQMQRMQQRQNEKIESILKENMELREKVSVGLCSVVLLWPMGLSVYLCVYPPDFPTWCQSRVRRGMVAVNLSAVSCSVSGAEAAQEQLCGVSRHVLRRSSTRKQGLVVCGCVRKNQQRKPSCGLRKSGGDSVRDGLEKRLGGRC